MTDQLMSDQGISQQGLTEQAMTEQVRREAPRLAVRGLRTELASFELAPLDIEVSMGEIVGLLGHNGCGKTTTFRIIGDLVRPTGGSVTLDELDHRTDEREFKRRVGFVGDNKSAYPGSRVGDALRFASSLYPRWDGDWCTKLCGELRLPLESKVGNLSTGMHTKLAIVLALSPRPDFLLLDEPTSGLDVESCDFFWDVIEDLADRREIGALVSSHTPEEVAAHCTRVVVLEGGRVRARTAPHETFDIDNALKRVAHEY